MSATSPTTWSLPRAAIWLGLAVAISLGVGGLVTSLDHPAGDATRPELTVRRDRAAAPLLATLATELDAVDAPLQVVRGAGREALRHVLSLDVDGVRAATASATTALDRVAQAAAAITATLDDMPQRPERSGLSQANQARIAAAERLVAALGGMTAAWERVASRTADDLAAGRDDVAAADVDEALLTTEAAAGALEEARHPPGP